MNDFSKYSDDRLLGLLKEQSPVCDRAFDVLFERYSARLNAYCIFKSDSRQDAEELFEDTWLKFLSRIRNGKETSNILPYLYSISRTIAIDRFRKQNAAKSVGLEFVDGSLLENYAGMYDIQTAYEKEEMISLIKVAVANLSDIYRETFVLQWFGGMSYAEIADITGTSIANAKMRSKRALDEIIKILKPHLIELSR